MADHWSTDETWTPGDQRRLTSLRILLAIAFLAGLILCAPLWQGLREYPVSPLFDGLPVLAVERDGRLFLLLLALLAMTPVPRVGPAAAAGAVAVLALEAVYDQSRLQPWVPVYTGMLVLTALASRPRPSRFLKDRSAALHACRLILAFAYIWSGIHKMNGSFPEYIFTWMMEPVARFLPVPAGLMKVLGYATPLVESLIGVGLLLPRFRPAATAGAVMMHAFLLYCLGPFGHNWNTVAWPWNLTMMALAVILFHHTPAVESRALLRPGPSLAHRGVLLYVLLMPALCRLGLWDRFLSLSVYSGNTPEACLHLPEDQLSALPWAARRVARPDGPRRVRVELMDWSMAVVNAPPYPELRIYETVAHAVRRRSRAPAEVVLRIY